MTGYLVGLAQRQVDPQRLKPLAQVVDERSLLGGPMLRLTEWMADYYLCPWGQVLEAVVPAGVRWQAGTRDKLFVRLAADALAKIDGLKLSAKQREIIDLVAAAEKPLDPAKVAQAVGCTLAPINLLRKRGLLVSETRRTATTAPHQPAEARGQHLTLNADQRRALDTVLAALESRQSSTVLLHGVTGSGKTEVYIQAIDEVLRYGRQAIVLVPEISLTPQTEQRFRSRFGRVAVLHSHQSDTERHRHWQQIAAGELRVVVGAAVPIFAPTPHLGPDRAGRGARSVVQARQCAALSRPRRGAGPGTPGADSAGARFGHPFAGELAACPGGRLSVGVAAASGFRSAAAGRRHDRSAARISESPQSRGRQPAIAHRHGRGAEGTTAR